MGDSDDRSPLLPASTGGGERTGGTTTQESPRSRPETTLSPGGNQYGSFGIPVGPEDGDPKPFYSSNLTIGSGAAGATISGRVLGAGEKDVESQLISATGVGRPKDPAYGDLPTLPEKPALKQLLGMRRSSTLLLTYVVFYLTFLVMGGMVFEALEGPEEYKLVEKVLSHRTRFLQENLCVTDDALEDLIREVMEASKRGVSAARNVTGEPNWSFGQSLFFSSTVITTIGYGHVTPLSKGGKIFCMVYATLGIPLTLVLLTALVERLTSGPSSALLRAINSRLGHLYPPFTLRLLHLTLLLLLLAPLLFFIPAGIFSKLEPSWDYLDALYYCFISLTTIGLGDYVPGDNPDQPYRPLYKVATTVYLLVGLTLMMLALTVFYDIPQLNFGLFFLPRSDEAQTGHGGVPGGIGDSEKARLRTPGALPGPKYTQQLDHCGGGSVMGGGKRRQHQVVRVKSRARDDDDDDEEEESGGKRNDADDSPSPGEDTTPVHAQRP
ncbi:potassium channel subfamily K member 6-like isoform X2 [Ischnura elegans]|uniref:potassium channel subfamily K member 6-like isoform X2 n=1 Tax=Ischnura elegans TaxID=197161 RepID=UPI001ED8AF71|nr:potassium channel subfamily K member 6-like isoform X2 [Ischnura elegans]